MTGLRFHIILLITSFIWSFSHAQEFTNYTTKNGLPSNHIYTITQDSEGFVWFLTDKGMVKYNGSEFKLFSTANGLPNNHIWEAKTTSDHKVWYLTKSNRLGYILKDSVYCFFNIEKKIMNPIFTNQVGDSVFPAGPEKEYTLLNKKWIISKKQTSNNPHFNYFIHHPNISHVSFDNTTSNGGQPITFNVKIYNHQNQILKTFKISKSIRSNSKRGQLNDSLYAWASDRDYIILNLNTLKTHSYNYKKNLGIDRVKHARINSINDEFQLSGTGLVTKLDKNFKPKSPYFFPENIHAHFGLIDKNNTIWLATFSQGVYKMPHNNSLIKYQLSTEKTASINRVNNKIICNIQGKGFYKFDKKEKHFKPYIKDNSYLYSATYIPELNREYYISENTIKSINPNQKKTSYLLNNTKISQQIHYHKGELFSNYSFGIHKITNDSLLIKKNYKLAGTYALISIQDQLFIASSTGLKSLVNDEIVAVDSAKELENKTLVSFTKLSDQSFLIHTDGFGSYYFDLQQVSQLKNSVGLSVKNATMSNDSIWIATNQGIQLYLQKENHFEFINSITQSDGLPSNNINAVVSYKNLLLVSSENGIAIVPKNIQRTTGLEALYFKSIQYNRQPITPKSNSFLYQSNNNLTFETASINFLRTSTHFEYSYRLEPIQTSWTTSKSNVINFHDLKPEKYTLHIKTGTFHSRQKFSITPLWYQQTLIKIGIAGIIIGLIVGLLYFIREIELSKKTKKIQNQKKMAEFELHALRSQMNPHFVFNSLNAIQYYITKNDIDQSEKYLVKFAQLIRMFFDFSSQKNISISQEMSLLRKYLEIEKMRFGDHFHYKIIIDPTIDMETKIPTMLLQPIVENSVNHGVFHNNRKGTVTIKVTYTSRNNIVISISDDGVGIKKSKEIQEKSLKQHVSKSTLILEDRILLINNSKEWHINYAITDLSDGIKTGTEVTLTFIKE